MLQHEPARKQGTKVPSSDPREDERRDLHAEGAIGTRAARRPAPVERGSMRLLDPVLNDLTPKHLELFWRYQVVRTGVDFGAASCFVVGSGFFFFSSLSRAADWLFLVGSLLFAVKPTIDMVRSVHLRRLPSDGHVASTGCGERGSGSRASPGRA